MTITGLTGGSDYRVKVRARFDTNPKSGWSSVATATAKEAEAPPPPVIVPPEPEPTPGHAEGHGSSQHFVLSHDSLTIPEGTSRSFTIALDSSPTQVVQIELSSSDTGALTVAPDTIIFTSTTWNEAQTINATSVDDPDGDYESVNITLTALSDDDGYDGETRTVAVTVNDGGSLPGIPRNLQARALSTKVYLTWSAPYGNAPVTSTGEVPATGSEPSAPTRGTSCPTSPTAPRTTSR